ncbi:hypothetical protein NHX12_017287 [Muraenolepis orangiensis]|uniref:DED domain-containing protein n=1 Tax=Muraenolepis orangiensis TaxID=630683 RepID=A0A9Q0D4U3_9TELE|nr:hypothetical protein NHX12_017287 [Muraenolepis orangiensis]
MAEYSSLLSDLSENITTEDLRQLKSACKEDIPEGESDHIACSRDWPDLLTRVIEYRTTVLKISEDDEVDTKLTCIPSAKKNKEMSVSQ